MSIDYDKLNHCVKCHKSLMTEVNGKLRFTADRTETKFTLNDESLMKVCICKKCKISLTDNDNKEIMKSVYRGWEEELKSLNWTPERKQSYLSKYKTKNILFKCEGMEEVDIQRKLNKIKKEKVNGNNSKTKHV